MEAILRKTLQAARVLVIDGCKVGCARKTLERAGFQGFQRLCVGELGIEKGRSPVSDERVQQVTERASQLLLQPE